MMNRTFQQYGYEIVAGSFCLLAVLANIISAKMVAFPIFKGLLLPAGIFVYPLTFLLNNFVTEVYGGSKARSMVFISLAMNVLAVGVIAFAVLLPSGADEISLAFQTVMGLSGLRIISSLMAFGAAQVADVQIYTFMRRITGDRFLWLRTNVSTCCAQLVDTFMVDILYLWWGIGMGMDEVLPIMLFSLGYKCAFGAVNTPLIYLLVSLSKRGALIKQEP